MGHARIDNISRRVNRMLRQEVSIGEILDSMEKGKVAVHASEGPLRERAYLAMVVYYIFRCLSEEGRVFPVRMTRKQKRLHLQWEREEDEDWDAGADGNGGDFGTFDQIRWTGHGRLPVFRDYEN